MYVNRGKWLIPRKYVRASYRRPASKTPFIPLAFCWRAERLNMVSLKEVFTKVNFERKKSADDKKA